jgi:signal transduction histidine kinase
MRDEGFPLYQIRPAGERAFYTSIVYIEPFEGRNLRAFGYDMYSEPRRRAAMQRARDTGEPAMTSRVRLVQETNSDVQPGFLIYLPVYAIDRPTTNAAERRAALVGWVYSPFRAADLMSAIFRDSGGEVEAMVFDGPAEPGNLLYATTAADRVARYQTVMPLQIGGRKWTAHFRSSEAFDAGVDDAQPNAVLVAGLLLSLVIGVVLLYETRHRHRLEAEVAARTRELVKARDDAESANRAKSAFLATVSHELRTPLNAIIGFSSILMHDVASPEQRKQLSIVNRAGLQLLDLVRDILDITSIEAGQVSIHPSTVPLLHLLDEQCEQLQAQAREAGLYLRFGECDESLIVRADPSRLSQVVRNLVSNGLKFTDRGGVTVRCHRADGAARVEIEDTGIGVPVQHRALLFTPFHRGGAAQGNRPGTGLGLAISRRLLEGMGGAIGFESVAGQGSRFWFTVPLARSDGAEDEA